MCGLCQLQHVFGNPLQGTNPVDAIKHRASTVKRLVRIHEKVMQRHRDKGEPECKATAERLVALRVEQFELARNL